MEADSDGAAGMDGMAVKPEFGIECRREALANPLRGGGLRAGRSDDGKFIAADARHEGAIASRNDPPRGLAKQKVAAGMAETIIDILDPIEVDAQDGEARPVSRGIAKRLGEMLVERRPVR